MGRSFLSEVANTSILKTGLPISQLVTDLAALASRAAGCRTATLCNGTNLPTSALQRFRPELGGQRTLDIKKNRTALGIG